MKYSDAQTVALLAQFDPEAKGETSIAGAAAALGLAQPNASRLIRAFEAETGLEVLKRTHRGSTLTATGREIARMAAAVVAAHDDFNHRLASLRGEPDDTVSIAASHTVADYLMPGWIAVFGREYPETGVLLDVENSSNVVRQVKQGQAELGFVEHVRPPRGVRSRDVGEDSVIIVARPDVAHLWAQRFPQSQRDDDTVALTPAQLAEVPLLVREPGSGTRSAVDRALAECGGVNTAAQLSSNAAIKGAIAAGLAPGAVSKLTVSRELNSGEFIEIDLVGAEMARTLRAVWAQDRPLSAAAAAFLLTASGRSGHRPAEVRRR